VIWLVTASSLLGQWLPETLLLGTSTLAALAVSS
jgi:hypothetical protein